MTTPIRNQNLPEQAQLKQKFQDIEEMLEYYRLEFRFNAFLDFNQVAPIPAEAWFKEELLFALSNR